MVKTKKYLTGILPVIVSIAIAVLFLSQPLAQAQQGAAPMTTQTTTGQVTPVLNTNVTWSLFNSSMAPNEYLNGSGDPQYLNAEPSMYNPNYITVNPTDIQSSQLETFANWTKNIETNQASGGQVKTQTNSNTSVTETVNTTAAQSTTNQVYLHIPIQKIPSTNLNFTYITIAYSISGANLTGEQANLDLWNTTGTSTAAANSTIYGSGTVYRSISLWQIIKNGNPKITMNYDTGTSITTGIYQYLPAAASTTYTLQITALDLTTYPIILGENSTGSQINSAIGNAQLTKFSPKVPMTVANGGYTESLSQPLGMAQNLTETQAAISSGPYTEEVTQQAIMSFPTAPDLTYGPSNMTLEMNGINASQVTLINVNGVSYSSSLSGFNGTSFNIGTENPNSANSVIIEIEYTAAQWNSFTSAPSFFSVAGIEYYWWIFIISTLGAVGLFAGLKNYANGKANNFREVPPPRTR